jgi:5'-nucleotidase
MRVIIDIDDTICNTIDVWLKRYRQKYKHNLQTKDLHEWDLLQYVVPECGNKIYDFLKSKTLYNHIKPLPYALDGVNALRDLGFEIIYVTGGSPEGSVYKHKWLIDNGFWNEKDHYIQTVSKFLIQSDLMIEDNYENITNSNASFKILIDAPWNQKYQFYNRVSGWKDITDMINEYMNIVMNGAI